MRIGKTQRGFDIAKFIDVNGHTCSIQKSSVATDALIWLGVDTPNPQVLHTDAKRLGIETDATEGWIPYPLPDEVHVSTRMHLNRQQVAYLIPALQRFVDTGELRDE